jgi:hypothetical protein
VDHRYHGWPDDVLHDVLIPSGWVFSIFDDTLPSMVTKCAALLLSLAFAGAPIVADYCAVSCESAHTHDAGAAPHAGHHNAASALFSIDRSSPRCGHDHNGTVAVTASSDTGHARAPMTSSAAMLPASLPPASVRTPAFGFHSSNSPPGTPLHGFASPIRI